MKLIKNKQGLIGCCERPSIIYAIILFVIGMLLGTFIFSSELIELRKENQQLKEGLGDFMMYMVNVTNYCAELNNMTHEELLQSYLRFETDKIVEEFGNSKSS